MKRREAGLSILAGLVLGTLYVRVGPLWTAYVLAVGAIFVAAWKQAGELSAARARKAFYQSRANP